MKSKRGDADVDPSEVEGKRLKRRKHHSSYVDISVVEKHIQRIVHRKSKLAVNAVDLEKEKSSICATNAKAMDGVPAGSSETRSADQPDGLKDKEAACNQLNKVIPSISHEHFFRNGNIYHNKSNGLNDLEDSVYHAEMNAKKQYNNCLTSVKYEKCMLCHMMFKSSEITNHGCYLRRCEVCPASLRDSASYEQHMRIHTSPEKSRVARKVQETKTCEVCNADFPVKEYSNHILSCGKKKRKKCSRCGIMYMSKLQRDLCGKCFKITSAENTVSTNTPEATVSTSSTSKTCDDEQEKSVSSSEIDTTSTPIRRWRKTIALKEKQFSDDPSTKDTSGNDLETQPEPSHTKPGMATRRIRRNSLCKRLKVSNHKLDSSQFRKSMERVGVGKHAIFSFTTVPQISKDNEEKVSTCSSQADLPIKRRGRKKKKLITLADSLSSTERDNVLHKKILNHQSESLMICKKLSNRFAKQNCIANNSNKVCSAEIPDFSSSEVGNAEAAVPENVARRRSSENSLSSTKKSNRLISRGFRRKKQELTNEGDDIPNVVRSKESLVIGGLKQHCVSSLSGKSKPKKRADANRKNITSKAMLQADHIGSDTRDSDAIKKASVDNSIGSSTDREKESSGNEQSARDGRGKSAEKSLYLNERPKRNRAIDIQIQSCLSKSFSINLLNLNIKPVEIENDLSSINLKVNQQNQEISDRDKRQPSSGTESGCMSIPKEVTEQNVPNAKSKQGLKRRRIRTDLSSGGSVVKKNKVGIKSALGRKKQLLGVDNGKEVEGNLLTRRAKKIAENDIHGENSRRILESDGGNIFNEKSSEVRRLSLNNTEKNVASRNLLVKKRGRPCKKTLSEIAPERADKVHTHNKITRQKHNTSSETCAVVNIPRRDARPSSTERRKQRARVFMDNHTKKMLTEHKNASKPVRTIKSYRKSSEGVSKESNGHENCRIIARHPKKLGSTREVSSGKVMANSSRHRAQYKSVLEKLISKKKRGKKMFFCSQCAFQGCNEDYFFNHDCKKRLKCKVNILKNVEICSVCNKGYVKGTHKCRGAGVHVFKKPFSVGVVKQEPEPVAVHVKTEPVEEMDNPNVCSESTSSGIGSYELSMPSPSISPATSDLSAQADIPPSTIDLSAIVDNVITCLRCDETFSHMSQFEFHIENKHKETPSANILVCKFCEVVFRKPRYLHNHKCHGASIRDDIRTFIQNSSVDNSVLMPEESELLSPHPSHTNEDVSHMIGDPYIESENFLSEDIVANVNPEPEESPENPSEDPGIPHIAKVFSVPTTEKTLEEIAANVWHPEPEDKQQDMAETMRLSGTRVPDAYASLKVGLGKMEYVCRHCYKPFLAPYNEFLSHVRIHSNKDIVVRYFCGFRDCREGFMDKGKFMKHVLEQCKHRTEDEVGRVKACLQ